MVWVGAEGLDTSILGEVLEESGSLRECPLNRRRQGRDEWGTQFSAWATRQPPDRLLPIIGKTVIAGQIVDTDHQLGLVETLSGAGQIKLSGPPRIAWEAAFALFIHSA